jgi:hypothetical protein
LPLAIRIGVSWNGAADGVLAENLADLDELREAAWRAWTITRRLMERTRRRG